MMPGSMAVKDDKSSHYLSLKQEHESLVVKL